MSWTGSIFPFGIYLRDPNIKASLFLGELTYTVENAEGLDIRLCDLQSWTFRWFKLIQRGNDMYVRHC